jgi:ribose-phosphate pyrophosphokinase
MTTVVFSTPAYDYLRDRMCQVSGLQTGLVDTRRFPDGEPYRRILTEVAERDVALVGGTISDADTLAVYDLACGIVAQGARTLTIIVPYFGCSTMERASQPGEVVTAKTRAQLLSQIHIAASGSRIVLLDLHSEGLPYYFEGGLRPVHLFARPVILAAVRALASDNFVLACTDAGRAKWVESLANDLGVAAAFVFKRRLDAENTHVAALSAQVQDRDVVIYDDMIRTGGSLMGAGRAYRQAGARRLWAVATHGVLPGDALPRLVDSGLFDRVVVTDSHPRAVALASQHLQVESVAAIFADYLLGRGDAP